MMEDIVEELTSYFQTMAGMSALSWLGIGLGGALTSLIGYANLPVTWLLPLQGQVPLNHLKTAQLHPLLGQSTVRISVLLIFYFTDSRALKGSSDLWSESGAVVMAVRRPG